MIGGFKNKVSDIDFKYTNDDLRISWVKTFYPHLGKLVSAIQNIDYKSYTYNGECNYIIVYDDDRHTELGDTIVIDVKRDTLDYSFFGGICYELLNDSSKNIPLLSEYVDPKGDIDVMVEIPIPVPDNVTLDKWEMDNPVNGCKCELIDMRGNLNPYYRDIALWIHRTFVEIVAQLQLDIPNSVDFDIREYYIRDTFDFREEIIGKSHVIMYVEDGHTIKIQLVYKILSEYGNAVIDHVVEFLITTNQSKRARQLTIKDSVVNVQSMLDLFIDNFEAHQKRTSFILKGYVSKYHKPINHTCRILYLFEYMTRNMLESYDWLNSFKRKIIDPFKSHRAYKTFNGSLIYYKIIKGVFGLYYLTLDDIINAYCRIFIINHVIGVCSNMDAMRQHLNEKYNKIQALILNNVREKSIPQSLKASINRLRIDAGKRKTIKNQKKRKERAKKQSSKKHLY